LRALREQQQAMVERIYADRLETRRAWEGTTRRAQGG
jgi:hypothetical protein